MDAACLSAARLARLPRRPAALMIVVCLLAALLRGTVCCAQDQDLEPNPVPVRSTTRWGMDLIAEGSRKSPSFRALVERLRRQRVIVYVMAAYQLPGLTIGATELLGVSPDFRYLRVSIGVRTTRKHQVALLGHELQHAVEIAEAPEVVDAASLALFYRHNGDASIDGYDSPAARAIGDVVLEELWRWPAEPAGEASNAGPRVTPAPRRPVNAELTRQ